MWTACVHRGMDPQAIRPHPAPRDAAGGPGGPCPGAVRRLLHTGIPLSDSHLALFPIVPRPYSYNL